MKHHPIDAFGISKVSLSSIRVDRLEDRVHPKVAFPHKHDFYQLILILSGSGQHIIDFKPYKVLKNQIYLMKPGQIHTWSFNKGIKGLVVEFNRDSLARDLHSPDLIGAIDDMPDVMMIDLAKLKTLAELMFEESRSSEAMMDLSLKNYLSAFLVQIIRYTGLTHHENAKSESLLEKFRHLVEDHFKQEHRVEFYATALGLSPKALTMQLSRLLGKSPRLVIQDRFLLEAKRYLAYSDLSIAEIGYEIGFEDANYFTRFFRLHESVTPAQFRNKSLSQRG